MTTILQPGADRYHTSLSWLDSQHSFSFGSHFDPENVGHGLLIVLNDDRVAPGGGFGRHSHTDMEIVTWVLSGSLAHQDSVGNSGVIHPGLLQRMSAGSGIAHSEMNDSSIEPVHFLQMWVLPDQLGVDPGYAQVDMTDQLAAGDLVCAASGDDRGAVRLHQRHAAMWVARPEAGAEIELPDNRYVHLFVAKGSGTIDGGRLSAGDAARFTDSGRQVFRAGEAGEASEIIVWESSRSVYDPG